MTHTRRLIYTLLLGALLSACTLTAPDAPATSRAPTGEAPPDVLTPNALRTEVATPTPSPTPFNEDTCRAVNEDVLAVRVSTDIMANEVTILEANSTSEIIGRTGQNTWWQVTTPDRRTGWVDASAVDVFGDCQSIPILEAPTLTVAPTTTPDTAQAAMLVNLNVRRGPSVRFNPPIGRFREGDVAEIIAVNSTRDWYKVVFEGSQGWISGADEFVTASGDLGDLPVDPGPPTPTATNTPIPATPTPTLDPNTNYLVDGGFEGSYVSQGFADLNAPAPWRLTYTDTPREYEWQNLRPVAFPHINGPEVRSGSRSQNINRNYATFTAVLYQQASVPANISVRARAYAWVHTCDPQPAICGSDASSNARARIGIDPTGGTNPWSGNVVWSGFITPHDSWGEATVSTVASGGTVTVFLYGTQDTPKGLNQMYWDDAGLFVGG